MPVRPVFLPFGHIIAIFIPDCWSGQQHRDSNRGAAFLIDYSYLCECNQTLCHMINRKTYLVPESEFEEVFVIEVICTSPINGGSEGTGEEEWVI